MKKLIIAGSLVIVSLVLLSVVKNPAPKCTIINGELACSMAKVTPPAPKCTVVNGELACTMANYIGKPGHYGPIAVLTGRPGLYGPIS